VTRRASLALWTFLVLGGPACSSTPVNHGSTLRAQGRTEVVFLPTLHRGHARESGYSFDCMRELVRAIAPDVVLIEVPPAVLARVEAASDARHPGTPADDPWLARRPEISEVLLPLRSRLHYQVVPVSGLTPEATRDDRAYFQAHPEGPDVSYYRRALRAVRVMRQEDDPGDEPAYALSAAYRRLVGWPRQALSTAAEDELGAAGPRRLLHAHFEHMRQAIAEHAGARILIAFDAADAWYLVPRLRRLPDVRYLDALAFYDAMDTD